MIKETSGIKHRGIEKLSRVAVSTEGAAPPLAKPPWIRANAENGSAVATVKSILRKHALHTVCEEAACPNLGECFACGTATFMILGDVCTRRCPFCDVAHGRPVAVDADEPKRLAEAGALLGLKYVVITSVNRDDLRDGGAGVFAECIDAVRARVPGIGVEVLVPDFRKRVNTALTALRRSPPDVFNHNLETVPRLYRSVRPGADYAGSLALIEDFKSRNSAVPTKSGLMLGLGETTDEVLAVMRDLRSHGCDMLTLGQYLRPSRAHLPVSRYATPEEFANLAREARALGFSQVASGPLVRSSYHADLQAKALPSTGSRSRAP